MKAEDIDVINQTEIGPVTIEVRQNDADESDTCLRIRYLYQLLCLTAEEYYLTTQ